MRHLLSAHDLSRDEAVLILDTAAAMAATQQREMKKLPPLRGKTVVNLFFEDSTRTRISFEAAAKRLSADVINFSAKGSSVSKGESLKDTALTLQAMGADAVVVRHQASGAPHVLAHAGWLDAAVVNAGDGTHQHPTQALLDAYTLRRHLSGTALAAPGASGPDDAAARGAGLDGRHVAIVGDVLHSRVARSNVHLLHTLGARVTLVAPPTLLPVGVQTWPCEVSYDLDATLAGDTAHGGPDAVMMLRVQRERMSGAGAGGGAFFPNPLEYSRKYGLDARRLGLLAEHAIVMHPGPMNRGLEISAQAADSPRAVIVEQVANGVAVRMAVLYLLLAGSDEAEVAGAPAAATAPLAAPVPTVERVPAS
ncbi:MAG TPA: aspartate carbamoyltransferase catalytic subunit [Actinotalea caeni]|uniref:aspartate carbamoyltransferase catalytic subunit n=1 Tax=Actinotalea caeni TaxID=1348467 RepID=UPI002B4B1C58|nr:aspartate carbamoyltransferase catalytic subunit [Actinotalea caeni]HLV56574.1 aspartate carbamoyltransferase catalytic subunit [Actinotalea caeni]